MYVLNISILSEAAAEGDRWDDRGVEASSDRTVPLLMQNKVPTGFETDDKLDVQLRPDEVDLLTLTLLKLRIYSL